jgi:hypothetical protein
MKNLKKIIAFFLIIFATGVLLAVFSVNKTLKKETREETVNVSTDTLNKFLVKKKMV